ncbi:cell division protein SepF [Candidatus Woesearchaeota archaeon]|nr:cell division protein SepF [Candidatus Woesearchaeota archaeon]
MKEFFSKIMKKVKAPEHSGDHEEGYVELDSESQEFKSKIIVRPFVLKDFDDVKEILDSLREGYTIALVNIKPLKDKDLVELKRSINKLKKTTDAIEGEIAGFGEDYIVVTPSFAQIYRAKESAPEVKKMPRDEMELE